MDPLPRVVSPAWKFALVGGLLSWPLTIGELWLSGRGGLFLFPAGIVAGYLAGRESARAARAGIGAGVVGMVPAVLRIGPPLSETLAGFAADVSIVYAAFAATVIVSASALFAVVAGGVGGALGGWLAAKTGGAERPSTAD